MNSLIVLINAAAGLSIFWVCGTFLLVGDRATCTRRLLLQLALLFGMAGGFAAGLAPLAGYPTLHWWTVMLHAAVAAIALMQYDQAFGIRAQLRIFLQRLCHWPHAVHAWWIQRVAEAERHARGRRP
jgi:hypothetical protein